MKYFHMFFFIFYAVKKTFVAVYLFVNPKHGIFLRVSACHLNVLCIVNLYQILQFIYFGSIKLS
jgi:hypothetical protein